MNRPLVVGGGFDAWHADGDFSLLGNLFPQRFVALLDGEGRAHADIGYEYLHQRGTVLAATTTATACLGTRLNEGARGQFRSPGAMQHGAQSGRSASYMRGDDFCPG